MSIRTDEPLEHVTTRSLEALRKYSQAVRLSAVGQEEAAIPLLQAATTIDTGFAMAWRKLSVLLANTGGSFAQRTDAARRAYSHRDRLPVVEGLAATATYYNYVEYDAGQGDGAYRAMLAIDPDNSLAQTNLSVLLLNSGRYRDADSLDDVREQGRIKNCFPLAMSAALLQGKLAPAESMLARWGEAACGSGDATEPRWPREWRGDYTAAAKLAELLRTASMTARFMDHVRF